MSGERGDVNTETVEDWRKRIVGLCAGYQPRDIFNMDETGIFFRDTTRHTFHVQGDDCPGGKRSKERITVLLCASCTGEKLKPLVIGKSKNPRCFKNIQIDSLPIHYYNNKKAWMTGKIYEDYLMRVNNKMKSQGRKILLFLDNAPSHPELHLSNIKIIFFPPNTTSYTQPMDQGIIQTTKLKFRTRQLNHMIKQMDNQPNASGSDLLKSINILDAIHWISHSYNEVEETTIQKCFIKAGFKFDNNSSVSETACDEVEVVSERNPTLDRVSEEVFGCQFNDLVNSDKNLHTCDPCRVDWDKPVRELLSDINEDNHDYSDQDDSDDEVMVISPTPDCPCSLNEADKYIKQLKIFALERGNSKVLDLVSQLDDEISVMVTKNIRQAKITEFFTSQK